MVIEVRNGAVESEADVAPRAARIQAAARARRRDRKSYSDWVNSRAKLRVSQESLDAAAPGATPDLDAEA